MRINHPIIPGFKAYIYEYTEAKPPYYHIVINKSYNGHKQFRHQNREKAIEFLQKLGFEYE